MITVFEIKSSPTRITLAVNINNNSDNFFTCHKNVLPEYVLSHLCIWVIEISGHDP